MGVSNTMQKISTQRVRKINNVEMKEFFNGNHSNGAKHLSAAKPQRRAPGIQIQKPRFSYSSTFSRRSNSMISGVKERKHGLRLVVITSKSLHCPTIMVMDPRRWFGFRRGRSRGTLDCHENTTMLGLGVEEMLDCQTSSSNLIFVGV